MEHIVILGNGISGTTAARHIRKRSDVRITMISAETPYFFSRTALMYIYMGHMTFEHTKPYEDDFWVKNRIELLQKYVSRIDFDSHELHFAEGGSLHYDKLILAVGSKPNKFGWPGQDLEGVQGLYSYQDLQLLEKNTHPPLTKDASKRRVKRAVIVGGGLIGVELAEMLMTRDISITFLVREDRFWGNVLPKEEGELVARHLREHHVDLRLNSELEEIISDDQGKVKAVKTKSGALIECQFVGLTAGVHPNIGFLKGSKLELNRGILVNRFLETNVKDVYAIGDCAEFREAQEGRRSIEQVWYTGRIMGETVARSVTGQATQYQPSNWFNSAKFFDIEYQTYGEVPALVPQNLSSFYWEDQSGRRCVRVIFESQTRKFVGINTFGIRMRHQQFEAWLSNGESVDYVMQHLADANFDPEFYRRYEDEIVGEFNQRFHTSIKVKKHSWKRMLRKVKS